MARRSDASCEPLPVVGDVVVVSRNGEQRVGEVVGVVSIGEEHLFEVSLEDVVLKGVLPEELEPATTEAIQATLGWLAMDPEFVRVPADARDGMRRAFLRQAYAELLGRALSVARKQASRPAVDALHAVGDSLVLLRDEAYVLGTVRGTTSRGRSTSYTLEVMGDLVSAAEKDVLSPEDARAKMGEGSLLGTRAYLAAEGHELDEDFAGTVSRAALTPEGWRYSLAFDDGDVMEDLSQDDLLVPGRGPGASGGS